jgi:hypothetical protein
VSKRASLPETPFQAREFEKPSRGRATPVILDVTHRDSIISGVEAAPKAIGRRIDVLAPIFHTKFSDLDQLMNFLKNTTMAGAS